ncbi:MAG: response regulator [Opitutaceae bacterium]
MEAGNRRFDLVLLDLTIPGGLGGCDALKAIRELDPQAKAVVMSGYTDNAIMRDPAAAGFQGSLQKPFTGDALNKLINGLL